MGRVWYTVQDKTVCPDCARHLAGELVRHQGDSAPRCMLCQDRAPRKPVSDSSRYTAQDRALSRQRPLRR